MKAHHEDVKRAVIALGSDTSHELVAAPNSGSIVEVIGLYLKSGTAQTWTFQTASTALSGDVPSLQTLQLDPVVNGATYVPWFVGTSGNNINLALGSGATLDGWVIYTIRKA